MVEIIPKPAQILPLWQNILFYFSLASILAAALGFFILANVEEKNKEALENLNKTLERDKAPAEKKLEETVFSYQKKIKDFSSVLEGHGSAAEFFAVLEKITHPKVWFSSLALNVRESKAVLSGETDNFQTLDQQLSILRNEKTVGEVDLSGIYFGREGKIQFTFNLGLNGEMFKFK